MLTHHQTQSVTMLQPILTVAPSPLPRETHFHSTQSTSTVAVRTESHVSLCSSSSSLVSPHPSDRDEQHQRGGWLGGVVPKPGGLSVPVSPPAEERNLHRRPPQAGGQLGPGRHEPLAGGGSQLFQQGLMTRQSSRVQMFHFVVFIRGRGAPNSCSRPRRRDTAMR